MNLSRTVDGILYADASLARDGSSNWEIRWEIRGADSTKWGCAKMENNCTPAGGPEKSVPRWFGLSDLPAITQRLKPAGPNREVMGHFSPQLGLEPSPWIAYCSRHLSICPAARSAGWFRWECPLGYLMGFFTTRRTHQGHTKDTAEHRVFSVGEWTRNTFNLPSGYLT